MYKYCEKKRKKKQIIMTIKKVMWRMLEQVPDSRLGLLAQVSLVHICQNSCVLISHHFLFHIILQTLQTQRAEQSSTFHVKLICSSLMIIYISSSLLVIIYTLAFQERKDSRVPPKHHFVGSQPIRQNALRRKIFPQKS